MNERLKTSLARFALSILVPCGIAFACFRVIHVNPTVVALAFLIAVLIAAAYWAFRYAAAMAIVATLLFNYFFLPPIKTFTIADPQNWVALIAFLTTALVASNLAERARRGAEVADRRRREFERLYALSQQLLTTGSVLELLNSIPLLITENFGVSSAALLLQGRADVYRSSVDSPISAEDLRSTLARGEPSISNSTLCMPLRLGVKTVGALAVYGGELSRETVDAIGGLLAIAIEHARAVEELSKSQAARDNEKLHSALMDSVTHEFRTPLTGIKASVSTLLSDIDLDESQRKDLLTVIDEETDRLNRLVGEAAEMSQLDAHQFTLDLEPHSIGEAIDAVVSDLRAMLQSREVIVSIEPAAAAIKFDLERIKEVLKHLIENAAKYSPAGTPIYVSAEKRGHEMVISVADQGYGIDDFEQTLIFDKFYRGRDQRFTAHGTGMGLAIAKAIVEAHGGRIGVLSQSGRGSVFHFSLPSH